MSVVRCEQLAPDQRGIGIDARAVGDADFERAPVLANVARPARRDCNPAFVRTERALLTDAIEREGLEAAGERYVWGEASRFDPKGAALIRQGFLEHDPMALAAILRDALAHVPAPDAVAAELAQLSVPTLVIVGDEDAESLDPCRRLAALIPEAELVVIPGAGHVVNLAAPQAFNAALADFLARLV